MTNKPYSKQGTEDIPQFSEFPEMLPKFYWHSLVIPGMGCVTKIKHRAETILSSYISLVVVSSVINYDSQNR